MKNNPEIAIIGLGYVGLPLAAEFGKKYRTIGYDIKENRIAELKENHDHTHEVSSGELRQAAELSYTSNIEDLRHSYVYIITVPTPVDDNNQPDLGPLTNACRDVGKVLSNGNIVIVESTVYPGVTEDVCAPVLERESGLEFNKDFYLGYSPERVNPGDKQHRITHIRKVVSGSTPETTDYIDDLYASIIQAGTYKAASIRVAEAAKVIENTQRDVNIALINELAILFDKMNIDTQQVLEAAGTKWNFLPFQPGLVGGHCIGVDPYYLTHKAKEIGYEPQIILAGRRLNDSMGAYVAQKTMHLMQAKDIDIQGSNILVMGITFKENCPDIRNSRVIDVIRELQVHDANVQVYDPCAEADEIKAEYGIKPIEQPENHYYDAVVVAVAHASFKEQGIETIQQYIRNPSVIFDLKAIFPHDEVDGRL